MTGATRKPGRGSGFTLIEMLVVLFLALLLVGLAVPRLGLDDLDRVRGAALRFRNVLQWLSDQATFGDGEYRLRLDIRKQSYHCERRLGPAFVPVTDPLLQPGRVLPAWGRIAWVPYDNGLSDADEVAVAFSPLGPEQPIMVHFSTPEGDAGFTVSFRPEWPAPRLTGGLLAWGGEGGV